MCDGSKLDSCFIFVIETYVQIRFEVNLKENLDCMCILTNETYNNHLKKPILFYRCNNNEASARSQLESMGYKPVGTGTTGNTGLTSRAKSRSRSPSPSPTPHKVPEAEKKKSVYLIFLWNWNIMGIIYHNFCSINPTLTNPNVLFCAKSLILST